MTTTPPTPPPKDALRHQSIHCTFNGPAVGDSMMSSDDDIASNEAQTRATNVLVTLRTSGSPLPLQPQSLVDNTSSNKIV